MSSAICQNFVQNAWKKELCSNCFKSKDEHLSRPKPKPIPIVSSRNLESIIRKSEKARPKRSVCFTKELTEIIGIGGEDWESDSEDCLDNDSDNASEEDFIVESEEEEAAIELKRLTKENTDFNTSQLKVEVKKVTTTTAQLMLGKPLVDSSGRKQTLMVSITPFGEDSPINQKKFSLITKTNKDIATETKSNVVLTSYVKNEDQPGSRKKEKSLLDEITETLENSKNPIHITSRKKAQKEIVLSVAKFDSNKENMQQNEEQTNTKIMNDKNNEDTKNRSFERKVALSRTPALKRDQEKPVVYQTSTARIELLNNRNSKCGKDDVQQTVTKKTGEPCEARLNGLTVNSTEIKEICSDLTKQKTHEAIERLENSAVPSETPKNLSSSKTIDLPPIQVPKLPKSSAVVPQSREQAGEPDGRADPEVTEPPALPLTPPPMLEVPNSFLHTTTQVIYDKPKVPSKPTTVIPLKKPSPVLNRSQKQKPQHPEVKSPILTTFSPEVKVAEIEKPPLTKQDSNSSDIDIRGMNKRRAPRPPSTDIYIRNSLETRKPEIKERRERASSCSPKLREPITTINDGQTSSLLPDTVPRKVLSMSIDNLEIHCNDEKRIIVKEKNKGRFSLKKFLKIGSNKDASKASPVSAELLKPEPTTEPPPLPKPKLVIVHPSELNGAKVEVVAKTSDVVDYHCLNFNQHPNEYEALNGTVGNKAAKPPPPPRNFDSWSRNQRPATLSRLPKSMQQQTPTTRARDCFNTLNGNPSKKTETIYANIGEVRSALVPNKPQRTASMREREAQEQLQLKEQKIKNSNNYEQINGGTTNNGENVYDYVNGGRSSSPDSSSSPNKNSPTSTNKTARLNKRSESSIDVCGVDYFKYGNIPRSMSLTYCGSETESEIYSPYGFYGSESEVTEDDHDWTQNGRTHKLRSRKGRSIVHKNLEDNYGAVIAANHEALAQVLENIQNTNHIQPALRGLKSLPSLRWTDFSVKSSSQPLTVGCRTFHQAMWGTHCVTLGIYVGTATSSTLPMGNLNLVPITEFSDLVPMEYVSVSKENAAENQIQATIAVFPWLQVNTIGTYSDFLKAKNAQTNEDLWKDATFIMLQLVNALKVLQAQGIEELSLSLNGFILCKEMDKEVQHKLYVLQGLGEEICGGKPSTEKYGTLCQCADKALSHLEPITKITPLLHSLLNNERSVTLTQVKSILEFCLWGPSDVVLGSTINERELALQRWLDLQRATVLHGLVCARVQLTVYEEYHLFFLVRSSSRMMCDASLLLESSHLKHFLLSNTSRCK